MGGAFLSASYASDDFNSTYFGVNATDAGLSGLSTFSAGGGIMDVNGLIAVVMHLSRKWHIAAGLRYKKLISDAADSPVVKDRGSADQIIVGIGFAYAWQ
jgi:outer membrane protein